MPLNLRGLLTARRLRRLLHYLKRGQYRIAAERAWRALTADDLPEVEVQLIEPGAQLAQEGFPGTEARPPKVSILIPVYNQWQTTLACLISIQRSSPATSYEVILADDCSTDATADAAAIRNLRVIRNPANLGFLRNCNHAAQHARGEYLVLLNNDTQVQRGWLDALVAVAQRDRAVAAVGPMLLYPDGRLQEAGGIVWSDGSAWNYGRNERANRPAFNYLKEVDYVSGACLLVRASFWREVKGFDERFAPAYYEDTDLAFSARRRGLKVIYQPLARVVHDEGTSHGRDTNSGVKAHQAGNRLLFRDKWRSVLNRDHAPGRVNLFLARDRSLGRKTLLFIDHHVPCRDRDAGSRSTFQYLSLMAELGYNVKFVGDSFIKHEPYTTELQQLGIEVLYGTALERGFKHWLARYGRHIDYAYLSRPNVAIEYIELLRRRTRARIVYCGHDLHFLRERRGHAIDPSPGRLQDAEAWERMELEVLRKVDLAYFFSATEVAEVARKLPGVHARAIPLFLYESAPSPAAVPDPADRNDLLFVANFLHPPNVDGITWFAATILPRVRAELPHVRLRIVGADPPGEVRGQKGVETLGRLSDPELDLEYRRARLVVAPLRYGGGIKGKIVEAMRHGIPVVTTTTGAEGIGGSAEGLTIADTPAGFADAIVRLYRDESGWSDSARRLLDTLQAKFSKDSARRILLEDMPLDDPTRSPRAP